MPQDPQYRNTETQTAEYEVPMREDVCNTKKLFQASNLWVIFSQSIAISNTACSVFLKRFCLSLINQEELIIVNMMQTLTLQVAAVHTDYKNIAALVY